MATQSAVGVLSLGLIVIGLLPLVLGGIFVILVVANRAEPDPSGQRPAVVYQFATSFVTLYTALFGSLLFVAALCSLIGKTTAHGGGLHPVGDRVAREAVLSLIVVAVAGVVLAMHLPAALRTTAGESPQGGPVGRVRKSYTAAVCFASIVIVVVALVVGVYQAFRLIAPGVFSPATHGRAAAVRILLPALYFAAAAGAVFEAHRRIGSGRPVLARAAPPGPAAFGPPPVAE